MRMLRAVSISVLVLAGCATTDRINRVNIGMTKEQVVAVMGQPTSTTANTEVEYLVYRLSVGVYLGQTTYEEPYYVRLRGGRVDSYGRVGDLDSTKDPTLKLDIQK